MKHICRGLAALVLLALVCTGAAAQDMVSIAELRAQAEAMGGWWKETLDTPGGGLTVNAPVIVPDVETMPVLTLEAARIPEKTYEQIVRGKKMGKSDQIFYAVDWDGEPFEVFLGYENDYVNGNRTDVTGYAAVDTLDMSHGSFRTSVGEGLMPRAEPTTYHYPWTLEGDAACLRGSDLTLDDAMRLWREDIAMMYPDEAFEIQPKTIAVRGSTLSDSTGDGKAYGRDGYFKLTMEQVICGVPLFGGIIYDFGSSPYALPFAATPQINRQIEKLNVYGKGVSSVLDYSYGRTEGRFASEESYRTITWLARVRTVEYADVPLAPLETVLSQIEAEIAAGNIRDLYAVRLGYILYANPEMTDHAWAIPRWIVDALYVTKNEEKSWAREQKDIAKWGYNDAPWEGRFAQELLVDAQRGELILFTIGDAKTFSVPRIVTWDDVR